MSEDEAAHELSLNRVLVDHMLDAGRTLFAIEHRISHMHTLTEHGRAELWERAIEARPGSLREQAEIARVRSERAQALTFGGRR